MIYKVFGVYDLKACAYLMPFFSESVGSAVRAFGDEANKEGSGFNRHPGDYQLFEIGTFDNSTAAMNSLVPAKLLGCAADFIVERPVLSMPKVEMASGVLGGNSHGS